ncbi:MAG: hypothetical protein Q9202_000047 [Teloschistes flavicans]
MTSPEAEKLRQQGNELYKSKNIPEAIKCYNEAAILAPKDPSPYSNLSAAHYEMGLYTQCISDIRTASQLAGTESSLLEKKLALRLAKAQLQTYDYQVAANTLAQMTKGQDKTVLGSICQRYIEYSQVDKEIYRREQLSQLPKCLCALGETKEYYVVGHDEACSQMDSNMFGSSERFISIFFAGIGDARNLYATLLKIDQLEQEDSAIPSRKYHLTINDIKAEALARDILVLFLLTEFDSIDVSKEIERTEALTTLFFLYIAPVVPQRIAELIQAAIDRLIDSLVPEKTIAEYLHICSDDIGPLVEALRSWRGQLRSKYSVAEALQMHLNHCKSSFPAYSEHVERSVEPNIWESERTLFAQTGVCRPPESWVHEYEPILAGIRSNKKHVKKIKAYVADKWTMNVTMLDSRWQGSLNDTLGAVLSFDPFGVADNLYLHTGLEKPQQKPYLYNYVARFFAHVATAIGKLRKRLVVEIMYGEVSDILETIRYNGSDRPETFPAKYDRVHLSNIPYVPCVSDDSDAMRVER